MSYMSLNQEAAAVTAEMLEPCGFTLRSVTNIGRRGSVADELRQELAGAEYRVRGVLFVRKTRFPLGDSLPPHSGERIVVDQAEYRIVGDVGDLGVEWKIEFGDVDSAD